MKGDGGIAQNGGHEYLQTTEATRYQKRAIPENSFRLPLFVIHRNRSLPSSLPWPIEGFLSSWNRIPDVFPGLIPVHKLVLAVTSGPRAGACSLQR